MERFALGEGQGGHSAWSIARPVSGSVRYDNPASAGTSAASNAQMASTDAGGVMPPAAAINCASALRSPLTPAGPGTAAANFCTRNCWLMKVPSFSKAVSAGITTCAASLVALACVPR